MENKIKTAVIGLGSMGRHHLRNYREIENSELVAASDPSPETKAIAEQHGVKLYEDYEEMIQRENIEAVSVVVPTPHHFEVVKALIDNGIHILVEKPIAGTLEEADKLIDAAKDNEVIFTVGHIERFNPVVRELRKIVAARKLGELSSVICRRLGPLPPREPQTDVIVDLAIHDIDIMRYILNRPLELVGAHGSRTFHSEHIDSAEILLASNGASGFSQSNWVTPTKIRKISMTGEKGYLEANYITQELNLYEATDTESSPESFTEFVDQYGVPKATVKKVEKEEPLKVEIAAFLGAVTTRNTDNLVDPAQARDALDIALRAAELIKERSLQ